MVSLPDDWATRMAGKMPVDVAINSAIKEAKSGDWDGGWEAGFDSALNIIGRTLDGCLSLEDAELLRELILSLRD